MATNRLLIVGDLFPFNSNLDLFCEGDVNALFGDDVCDMFAKADYRICNLEGVLTDGPGQCKKTGPVIKAPTLAVNAYKALGIDCCMLANNHITDAGTQGVKETLEVLDNACIRHIGVGLNKTSISHYTVINIEDNKICIYNVGERMYNMATDTEAGVWLYDEYLVCKELESMKSHCDYLIVIYHGGIEKFQYPSPETRKRFHRMADSGADVVLSQHTHCIGCEEYYKGAYLLYGQGDFLFNNFNPSITDSGLIIEISFNNKTFEVNKHKTKTTDFRVRYNKMQDFSDFEKRSAELKDEAFVESQFQRFCYKELRLYLSAYKSLSRPQRALRKFFPSYFKKWLYHHAFKEKDLLFALHTLRSEQNRETAIVGLEKLLNDFNLSW